MDLYNLDSNELEKKKTILEIEKLEKEKEKLKNEIAKQESPFHRNSDNWGKILTFLSALAALFIAQYSGWFDTKRESLAIEIRTFDSIKKKQIDSVKLFSETILIKKNMLTALLMQIQCFKYRIERY